MVANLHNMAKAHYSRLSRQLFTALICGMLLCLGDLKAQEIPKSRVVKVQDKGATRHFKPHVQRVANMVEAGLINVTDQPDPKAAWTHLLSPKDIVGLKVNAEAGPLVGTRPAVVAAVIESLLQGGISPDRIIIWDREMEDLKRAGYDAMARKYRVGVAGAAETGFDEWDPYTRKAFYFRLTKGDRLYGQKEIDNASHLSRLVTQRLTAIISIQSPTYFSTRGATGHLTDLALASVDNVRRFYHARQHFRADMPDLCHRIAWSHTLAGKQFRVALDNTTQDAGAAAQAFSLFRTTGKPPFFYFQKVSEQPLPPNAAVLLAKQEAEKEKTPQEIALFHEGMAWKQLVLPGGRLVLKRDNTPEDAMHLSKLRLHITDALICQYHHGGLARPDYAAAINELWFSPDPLALDLLADEMIQKLRTAASLPKNITQGSMLRPAQNNFLLGNAHPDDWDLRTINLGDREPE